MKPLKVPSKRRFGKKRLSEYHPFKEESARVRVEYSEHLKCARCGDSLEIVSVLADDFPYTHTDIKWRCPMCDAVYIFGIPRLKDIGLALIVFDTNPSDAAAFFKKLDDPKCPWGHGKMYRTKVFGDWIPREDIVEMQWKCPVCFLTCHESYARDFPHGESDLTQEEKESIRERLERLGYLG